MTDETSTQLAWLEDDQGRRYDLGPSFSVGRSSGCSLTVADSKVSRKHASINDQGGGEYWISDLGSANGTRVNGTRVGQPMRLRNGDRIEIGSATLRFLCPGDPTADGSTQMTTQQTLIDLRREARWLLVADIENSTMLASSLEPEIYKQYVDEWFRKARVLIEKERGSINKFLGDGFLACWPPGEAATEQVARVLERLKEVRDDLPFRFRLAVHYGEIIMGGIGSVGEESLSGPEVNFVFRMEKIAGVNGISILLSQAAMQALGGRFEAVESRRFLVPGFAGEHEFHVG